MVLMCIVVNDCVFSRLDEWSLIRKLSEWKKCVSVADFGKVETQERVRRERMMIS